jgi:hypothetical protein
VVTARVCWKCPVRTVLNVPLLSLTSFKLMKRSSCLRNGFVLVGFGSSMNDGDSTDRGADIVQDGELRPELSLVRRVAGSLVADVAVVDIIDDVLSGCFASTKAATLEGNDSAMAMQSSNAFL